MNETKKHLIGLFLDWFNNYLTLDYFASDYGLTKFEAQRLINIGRKYHNENAEKVKKEAREQLIKDKQLLNQLHVPIFYFEVTDSEKSKPKFSYVHRYAIEAKNQRGAMIKLSKETHCNFLFNGTNFKARKENIVAMQLTDVSNQWLEKAKII